MLLRRTEAEGGGRRHDQGPMRFPVVMEKFWAVEPRSGGDAQSVSQIAMAVTV